MSISTLHSHRYQETKMRKVINNDRKACLEHRCHLKKKTVSLDS